MTNIIFFTFAGRQANMEIQRPHVTALLDQNPGSQFHLWDLTRTPEDQQYIREWAASDDRVAYLDHLHPGHPIACSGPRRRGHKPCVCMKHRPPFEEPYRYYAAYGSFHQDTVFVKFDDDVIWMDTEKFPEVLAFLETHPESIASANVTNNAVCAKYEPGLERLVRKEFDLGDPYNPEADYGWWEMHKDSHFARMSHDWLLTTLESTWFSDGTERQPFRTREGEAVSINFVAMTYKTLCFAASRMMRGRYGDEGTIDAMLPWIVPNFRVAHLTFGPQEPLLTEDELDAIRARYAALTTGEDA